MLNVLFITDTANCHFKHKLEPFAKFNENSLTRLFIVFTNIMAAQASTQAISNLSVIIKFSTAYCASHWGIHAEKFS
ncbi:hypothetical protein [uncultured Helicobacter sp.]|uniref:hypothetical protein n=1 Tax=uncultured Helicobacter sp. TaxID=175537 RepID=UPI002621DF6F|nr:hypothetical protein [uncultured Helicobacter sp.]